ncbi:chromo domain-containing protein [Plectosphaerella plurivora]|uniref:Chromo domain-containing protein n=1 Tax=Plectosphaerella plurivora TaxID=936078 RepID=A0A9P8V640_9PEZI|nr:chromo domain-containing protein [Plectosphaerella plurivora]
MPAHDEPRQSLLSSILSPIASWIPFRSDQGTAPASPNMPPAISDDEQSDIELVQPDIEVPLREKRISRSRSTDDVTNGKAKAESIEAEVLQDADPAAAEDDEEEEDGDDDDEEVFNVEKILDHKVDANGEITFRVKWEGYEKKADQTWEPEENLIEGAAEILEEYYKTHGGKDTIVEESGRAKTGKKRGRASTGGPAAAGAKRRRNGATNGSPPASGTANAWKPPSGSWEEEIETIDACEDEESGKLIVYLNWKAGHKTKHTTDVVYKRCPQKMLQFYEKHIRIIKNAQEE